ncbi:hypothetical protein ANANG_G00206920 [Anguilla anguilla]|uniref:Uncharacterized protein n=1 Tax=Anguilla anguilla TaxID=7936 RepID=A0A9D3LZ18_ANGAN|nr:hypothetical protein ANANG_G00206920 [Anguilla anguilla]
MDVPSQLHLSDLAFRGADCRTGLFHGSTLLLQSYKGIVKHCLCDHWASCHRNYTAGVLHPGPHFQ